MRVGLIGAGQIARQHLAGVSTVAVAASVVGTERRLASIAKRLHAAHRAGEQLLGPRLVSISGGVLDEDTPELIRPPLYERDGYAVAKLCQERIIRRDAAQRSWDLTVLRPASSAAVIAVTCLPRP